MTMRTVFAIVRQPLSHKRQYLHSLKPHGVAVWTYDVKLAKLFGDANLGMAFLDYLKPNDGCFLTLYSVPEESIKILSEEPVPSAAKKHDWRFYSR